MQDPDLFAKNNHATARKAKIYLERYRHLFKWDDAPEDMLDVGCANGRITREVLFPFVEEHLGQLIGGDVSKSAVDVGNETYRSPNVRFEQMDIEDGSVGDRYEARFGHIFAFLCFEMVHRDDLWSANVCRMLKPNGQLFATFVVNPCIYSKVLTSLKGDKAAPWTKYIEDRQDLFVDYGPDPMKTISEILERAGFVVDGIDLKEYRFAFAGLQSLTNTFLGIEPYSKYIPAELRGSYNEEYIRRCMEHADLSMGHSYNFDVVSVLATKK